MGASVRVVSSHLGSENDPEVQKSVLQGLAGAMGDVGVGAGEFSL